MLLCRGNALSSAERNCETRRGYDFPARRSRIPPSLFLCTASALIGYSLCFFCFIIHFHKYLFFFYVRRRRLTYITAFFRAWEDSSRDKLIMLSLSFSCLPRSPVYIKVHENTIRRRVAKISTHGLHPRFPLGSTKEVSRLRWPPCGTRPRAAPSGAANHFPRSVCSGYS